MCLKSLESAVEHTFDEKSILAYGCITSAKATAARG
jgi:hypothetical protein